MARKDDLRRLIELKSRRLQKLKEQQALLGISVDPTVPIEIDDIETEIERLHEELSVLEDRGQQKALGPTDTLPTVFVSYSHKDEIEKEELLSHLTVLERAGVYRLWVDDHIEGGADWQDEIKQAIAEASVVILLISNNFLLSDFISDTEVPAFLERRANEGITVFPIIAKYSGWWAFDWLNKMNVRPKNGLPIWRGKESQVDKELYEIAREIALLVRKQRKEKQED